jgi:hypothetical protein
MPPEITAARVQRTTERTTATARASARGSVGACANDLSAGPARLSDALTGSTQDSSGLSTRTAKDFAAHRIDMDAGPLGGTAG